jgi:prepilin-type processing-associated H-X9-DG protein
VAIASSAGSRLSTSASGLRARFAAPERLRIHGPEHAAGLGQPIKIPLEINGANIGAKIVAVEVEELSTTTGRSLRNEAADGEVGSGSAKLVNLGAGSATIEVIPLEVGPVRLRVNVLFADGGWARKEALLNVVPSQRNLDRFDLNKGFHSLALVLEDRDEERQAFLVPAAKYDTLKFPIYLDGSEQLNLTVDQPEDGPVIRVDADGLVHALRAGTAMITADFDGIKDSVAVDVYSKEDAPDGYRRSAEE